MRNAAAAARKIGVAVSFLTLAATAHSQPAAGTRRLQALIAKGANAEITVFPVLIGDRAMPQAGEVLAVMLERAGMQNLALSTEVFRGAGETAFDRVVPAFGDFIRKNAISTEYALYAEFPITPGTGFTEIRGIVADKAGEPVLTYRLSPADEEFRKQPPREPMQCIVLLVNGLGKALGLQDPMRADAPEGRIARRMAERTGLPTESERAAIKKAQEVARAKIADSKVVVFPVLVAGRADTDRAARLADKLTQGRLGKAEAGTAEPGIQPETGPNEAQRLWRMARAFRDYLRGAPPAADFAVLADYMMWPGQGRVLAVHFIVCDRNGEWVAVDMQNDHHPDFQALQPKSADDCDALVVKRLRSYMGAL